MPVRRYSPRRLRLTRSCSVTTIGHGQRSCAPSSHGLWKTSLRRGRCGLDDRAALGGGLAQRLEQAADVASDAPRDHPARGCRTRPSPLSPPAVRPSASEALEATVQRTQLSHRQICCGRGGNRFAARVEYFDRLWGAMGAARPERFELRLGFLASRLAPRCAGARRGLRRGLVLRRARASAGFAAVGVGRRGGGGAPRAGALPGRRVRASAARTRCRSATARSTSAWLGEVLEHVRDGLGLLAEVARVIGPGGLLVASTPDHGWWLRLWLGLEPARVRAPLRAARRPPAVLHARLAARRCSTPAASSRSRRAPGAGRCSSARERLVELQREAASWSRARSRAGASVPSTNGSASSSRRSGVQKRAPAARSVGDQRVEAARRGTRRGRGAASRPRAGPRAARRR